MGITEHTTAVIHGSVYNIYFVTEFPDRLKPIISECSTGVTSPLDREIYVLDTPEEGLTDFGRKQGLDRILRHEIIHAYLYECGLSSDTTIYDDIGWANNEEMVDWFAIQSPRIFETFKELGIIEE